MPPPEPTVFVVDDDAKVRNSLCRLISTLKLPVQAFESAMEFLDAVGSDRVGCVIIDVRMPEMSGLQLLEALAKSSSFLPAIVVTGHADVPMTVRAMKTGAIDLIEKPYNDQELLELILKANQQSIETYRNHKQRSDIRRRYDSLSRRERQVLEGVIAGNPNKTVAADLGLSQKTIDIHRAKVMGKMHAKSFAELVGMVTEYRLTKGSSQSG